MNPKDIKALFEKLKEATTEPETVAKLCERYLSEDTPHHELSIMGAAIDTYKLIGSLKDRESGLPIIDQTAECLTSLLQRRGYRNNIETHQEHQLIGSSGSGLSKGNEFPYTVGAILKGEISVEEARQARKLNYMIGGALGVHWGLGGIHCLLLPEIDDKGITMRDPVLVDSKGNVLAERLVDGAPYKR